MKLRYYENENEKNKMKVKELQTLLIIERVTLAFRDIEVSEESIFRQYLHIFVGSLMGR